MAKLIAIESSPWSIKARWALDHHLVDYDYTEYLTMLGEPWLRVVLRRPLGKVTVPVFVDDNLVLTESLDIARHAESVGSRGALFPSGRTAEVERWNLLGDRLSASGRALATFTTLRDPAALAESLPPVLPAGLRRRLVPVAKSGARFLERKYGLTDESATHEDAMSAVLDALRAALTESAGDYLLGDFSYADIAMAAALQFVEPAPQRFVRLGRESRRTWGRPRLAERYRDLLDWRDRLLETHHRR